MKREQAQLIQQPGAWAEINLTHLVHNATILQGKLPAGGQLMAVVKADGYGHGAVAVSRAMNEIGVTQFGVANLAEGICLREGGIVGEILIFGHTALQDVALVRAYDLTQTLIDEAYAEELLATLAEDVAQRALKVQLKVDTGMHRYGFSADDTGTMARLLEVPAWEVTGIYSHLAACDLATSEGMAATRRQAERFSRLLEELRETLQRAGNTGVQTHLQSSYGVLNLPDATYDMARVGIALYGAVDPEMMGNPEEARLFLPVLSVKARVVLLREVKAGESAGYGLEATAERDRRVALVSIGYADGIPRRLGGGEAGALIRGERVPIVGRVCMDCLLVDVSAIAGVAVDDVAVLIDGAGEGGMTVAEMARHAGTIPNEIVSRLGSRLPKVYLR